MVVMLRQCCCGCTLKTGTIIIGILNALGAAGSLISAISVTSTDYTFSTQDARDTYETLQVVMIVVAVIAGILLVAALCVIAGAVTDNPVLLLPWLIYALMYLCINTILYIVMGGMAASISEGGLAANYFVSGLLYFALELYFLLVVYSFYRELKGTAPPLA